jgi:hypothetical protein
MHSKLMTAARFSSCFMILLLVRIFVASCFRERPIWFSFIEVCARSEISADFFAVMGAEVTAFESALPAGVVPDRPGVVSWLSVEAVRSMLTDLWSFFGVTYWACDFCALGLPGGAGELVAWGVGVTCRSFVEDALGRFAGTARDASSSALGRFSEVLVLVGAAFVVDVGVDVSGRRWTILGVGLGAFVALPSTGLVCTLAGDSFGTSGRSFFSGFARLGGNRRSDLMVVAFAFGYFSLTTRDGSVSSAELAGATSGGFPLTDTVRMRGSFLTVFSAICDRGFVAGTVWSLGSDEDTDALDSGLAGCSFSLSSSI